MRASQAVGVASWVGEVRGWPLGPLEVVASAATAQVTARLVLWKVIV